MKYPFKTDTIIDVTKPPYCADNSGMSDCTAALRRVFDDVLKREIEGIRETEKKLWELGENVFIGFENRIRNNSVRVIYPEFVPPRRIIYFPAGTYLVSDTVTYTLTDLQNIMNSKPFYELTRGIHLMGESCENTVIKLADNSKGFGKGCEKAVVSYTNAAEAMERECSNVSQLNTFNDLSIDCGSGNEGAVGLRFVANNSGRVENVVFYGKDSSCALQLVVGTEGVFRNVQIDGFDTGITASQTSMCIFDGIRFGNLKNNCVDNRNARMVFWNCKAQGKSLHNTDFYFVRSRLTSEGVKENQLYSLAENIMHKDSAELCDVSLSYEKIPSVDFDVTQENTAFVDDYGAIGDGKTDCTTAIQAAFNSGKEVILFGSGHYLVNGRIYVPDTARLVDFMFCDLFAGENLKTGKSDSVFVVDEESERPLHFEHLYAFEQFYGHFRLIKHASKRTLVLKDIHTQTAATYFNITAGGKVYLDNCACTTGSYSMNTILNRGTPPEYCGMIPYEFHGQSVWAYNLNPERADVEVLNDASTLIVFGLKVEGPGTAVRTVNGGQTGIYLSSGGIGNPNASFPLFYTDGTSNILVLGGQVSAMSGERPEYEYYCISEKVKKNGSSRALRNKINPFAFDIID